MRAVERAFAVLEAIAQSDGRAAVTTLAAELGLPAGSTHRVLTTLVEMGYVRQLMSHEYVLGPNLIRLGDGAYRLLGIWAAPILADVAAEIGKTANLATLDGDRAVYLAQAPSAQATRTFTQVGSRVSVHNTGVGKVLLSQLAEVEVRKLIERAGMPKVTAKTITDPDRLVTELRRTRRVGYALDDGERVATVRCLAVPVLGGPARLALSISGPAARLPCAALPHLARTLTAAAAELARTLES